MIAVVIPAKNESNKILRVLKTVQNLAPGFIIPVVNGSTDGTLKKVIDYSKRTKLPMITLCSKSPMGLDIPRAVGAKVAFDNGADYVLFIDADMDCDTTAALHELVTDTLRKNLDMTLVDCYANRKPSNSLAELVVFFRKKLNMKIGLADILEEASPSHGPHMVSRRLVKVIPLRELAIPPVSLALAAKAGLKINIGAKFPAASLGKQYRDDHHSNMLAKLIIGDCIEAMNVFDGKPRTRYFSRREFIGYHCQRNFQLLSQFLTLETHKNPRLS